jgi:hypothetical protein
MNQRRRDNTMANTKRTKVQTTIYKALHKKLKIEQHEPYEKPALSPLDIDSHSWVWLSISTIVLLDFKTILTDGTYCFSL